MRVKVAGTAGFCWGVQRALRRIDAAAKDGKRTATLGPLVHNGPLLARFQERKIATLESTDQAGASDLVVTRPHGALQDSLASLEGRGAEVLDVTCPHVAETRKLLDKRVAEKRNVLVAGNRDHDEVRFLLDGLGAKAWVIGSAEEARTVAAEPPLVLVAQSTLGPALFEDIVEAVKERWPDSDVNATRCGATEDRQDETERLSVEADVLVVVGAYHSGSARRLAEMCRESGKQTFHVETPEDLQVPSLVEQARLARRQALMDKHADDPDALREATSDPARLDAEVVIGVTAGAATPPWALDAVLDHLVAATGATLERRPPRDDAPGGA
jgi:4-hydroxy-3-methylbut-2-enyl diphosphate reductase